MRDLELMEKEVLDLLSKHANTEQIKATLAPLIAKTSIEIV